MEVFFYGLFIDANIFLKYGIIPSSFRKGTLADYTLKIGNRASLIQSKNEKVYGLVMTMKDAEVSKLYSENGVVDYIPEIVEVITEANEHVNSTCYNLPLELLGGTNVLYAKSLYELAKKLKLPDEYLEKIRSYI